MLEDLQTHPFKSKQADETKEQMKNKQTRAVPRADTGKA
jgi:hypothetical protein